MRPNSSEEPPAYPILAQIVDGPPSTGGMPSDGSSPTRIAADAIRQVLGWRYRAEDLKGFQASLAKSFVPRYVDDSLTVYEWQRMGAATVDETEITGALASFYNRAKVAVDQAVPLLNTLTALRPDADPEDTEAIRSIVIERLQSLPGTLAVPGGPPPQRINMIFQLLLGGTPENSHTKPESVGGELGDLRKRFGLVRNRVNTIEEELNFTNFVIIVDYVASLHQTWKSQARFFQRGGSADPYLGNQSVLIKYQLDVVADSVARSRMAMESVYFNLNEQRATFLDLGPHEPPITVAELLDWIMDATQLKPDQLQSKDGIKAVRAAFEKLHDLVAAALNQCSDNLNNSTRGFYTVRVQLALDSLEASLLKALQLANQIHRGLQPVVQSVRVLHDVYAYVVKAAAFGQFKRCDSKIRKRRENDDSKVRKDGEKEGLGITGKHFQRGAGVRLNPVQRPDLAFHATTVSMAIRVPGPPNQHVLFATFKDDWPEIADLLKHGADFELTVINPDGQSGMFTFFNQEEASPGAQNPTSGSAASTGPSADPGGPESSAGTGAEFPGTGGSRGADEKTGYQAKAAAPVSEPDVERVPLSPKTSGSTPSNEGGAGPKSAPKKS